MSEINYVVDIWARPKDGAGAIAIAVNAAMISAGFVREFAGDVYHEGAAAHKTMRYRFIGG